MITPEQIPDEVVEAAARATTMALILAVDEDCRALALTDDERAELARAAIAAALNAWEGAHMGHQCTRCGGDPQIILPLSQKEPRT